MNAGDLKEVLQDVPDDWKVMVEEPEGDRYTTQGARGDESQRELIVEL